MLSSAGKALASNTKTRLFALAATGISDADNGAPLPSMRVKNLAASAANVVVYCAPIDGPELTDAAAWPTNADTSLKGQTLEPGDSITLVGLRPGGGIITQVWARATDATVTFGPSA